MGMAYEGTQDPQPQQVFQPLDRQAPTMNMMTQIEKMLTQISAISSKKDVTMSSLGRICGILFQIGGIH